MFYDLILDITSNFRLIYKDAKKTEEIISKNVGTDGIPQL